MNEPDNDPFLLSQFEGGEEITIPREDSGMGHTVLSSKASDVQTD